MSDTTKPTETAKTGETGPKGSNWVVDKITRVGKGIWGIMTDTASKALKVAGLGVEATAGQVTGEMEELGRAYGFVSKEAGVFNKIGEIAQTTFDGLAVAAGWVLEKGAVIPVKFSMSAPGRVVKRFSRAAQGIWNTGAEWLKNRLAMFGIKIGNGGHAPAAPSASEARAEEAGAAAAAGAHPA